jgi:HEAT repeat protein
MALVSLLQMMPRPMLAKAIIFSLGKMGRRQSIPVIINYLEKNDREDIQLVGINALSNFKGHELDLYYTHTLENLIKRQTALGELRLDVFTAIADRILSVATLTVLKVLEESAGNHNAIANCLNLLGIIAVKNNDHELYDILAKYLDISYPRRVRSNAIMYLYRSKKYQHLALEGIDAFMTSKDAFDRSAVAFVAGELKLTGLLPYVIECSIELQHNNSTLLVSLLKLKYKESFKWFVDYIVSANDKETLTALNQFHTIKNQSIRYAVYFELIKSHPAKISYILDMLRNTKRNFDQDRQAIVNEATNVGIELVKDNELFTVAPVVESSNTPVPAEIPKAA